MYGATVRDWRDTQHMQLRTALEEPFLELAIRHPCPKPLWQPRSRLSDIYQLSSPRVLLSVSVPELGFLPRLGQAHKEEAVPVLAEDL